MKKSVLFSVLVLALVGAQAQASITIPWQTNAYGTYQMWSAPLGEPGVAKAADPGTLHNAYGAPTAAAVRDSHEDMAGPVRDGAVACECTNAA
jgi:hypothetical protein